jgi:hypothetical protein
MGGGFVRHVGGDRGHAQPAKRNTAVPMTRNYIRDDELNADRNLQAIFSAP